MKVGSPIIYYEKPKNILDSKMSQNLKVKLLFSYYQV